MNEPLSPAAQVVLDAFLNGYTCSPECNVAFESDRNGLAAALEAVAGQVAPSPVRYSLNEYMQGLRDARENVRRELLAIAAELEGHQ